MAKFRAHIVDPLRGESRVEIFKAANIDKARQKLEKKGYTVLRVDPHWERPLGDATPWQELQAFVGALVKVGLVLAVAIGLFLTGLKAIEKRSGGGQPGRVAVIGKLVNAMGGSPEPETVKVTLRWPKVPFSLTWTGSEIMGPDGALAQQIDMSSLGDPGQAEVMIEVAGFQPVVESELSIADQTMDLGEIVLRRDETKPFSF